MLGGAIGILTGLLAFGLIEAVAFTQDLAFGKSPNSVHVLLVTTGGAFAVGLLITYWSSEPAGGGLVEVIRTNSLRGGRFRARVPFAMLIATAIGIGTGASGGREAPIVLGGGALGSLIGTFFGVDDDRRRTLVAAGAAAGIGASFNAPIGGMLFAIELILGRLHARSLQVVVLAAVAGSVTARELVGPEIAFAPSEVYRLGDPRELLGYALIGLLAVLVGLAFLHGERIGHDLFAKLKLWRPLKLALAGLGVGLMALAVPEILGSGHLLPPVGDVQQPIQAMIDSGYGTGWEAVRFLLILLVAKLGATLLSVTSGNAVGSLLPTLFTGAALGGAVGQAVALVLPDAGVQPGAFALVGMAAVFAAAARTPLTAILIVFELTGDYGLVLPLMLAAGLATIVADRIEPDGIYLAPLRRAGIVVYEPDEIDVMQSVKVGEVMTHNPPVLPAGLSVAEIRREFDRTRHHGFAVVDHDNHLLGVLTQSDLDRASKDATSRHLAAGEIATSNPLTVKKSDPVFRALHRMATNDVGRLPVVDEHDPQKLVGMLRRNDIIRAYQRAVNRGIDSQQRRDRSRLRNLSGVLFTELTVTAGCAVDGRLVAEVAWPAETIVTSIRRGGSLLVPHGDTVLHARDNITMLGPAEQTTALTELFRNQD